MSLGALKQIQRECGNLYMIGRAILDIADSYAELGNDVMAEKMERYANTILDSQKIINRATSAWVENELKNAQESARATVNAALAGAELARSEPLEEEGRVK